MIEGRMPKRITITLPDPVHKGLGELSELRDKAPAALAAEAVEVAIRQAASEGKISPLETSVRKDDDVAKAWRKLIDGESLTPDEEAAIAEVCDRSPAQVHDVVKRLRERGQ